MKHFSNIFAKTVGTALLVAGAAACDYIHDDSLEPCEYRLHFVYDYNMKFADAFQHEVSKVSLFLCDDKGNFLMQRQIEGDELKANNVKLDLEPGTYYALTWAGLDEGSYEWPQLTPGSSTIQDIKVRTLRNADATMNVDDFTFEITADNGYMDYDNTVLDDPQITYLPYYTESIDIASGSETDEAIGKPLSQMVAVAEMNTMRLMAGENYRLVVRHKDWADDVLNINLPNYLLLTQMEGHNMSAQEYLDRQDEYSIIFFLTPILCPDCPDPEPEPEPEPEPTPDPDPDPDPDYPDPPHPIVGYACYKIQVKDWVIRLNNGEL